MPETPFEITKKDFKKVVLDYMLFEKGIDKKDFEKTLLESVLYESDIDINNEQIKLCFSKDK